MSFADIGRFLWNTQISGAGADRTALSVADRDARRQARPRRHCPAAGLCPFAA